MTVRCDACGTENRDKAMFCRGCAGKLPAFVPTRKPADGQPDGSHRAARTPGTSAPSVATNASPSTTINRSRFGLMDTRTVVLALLIATLGTAFAWFAWTFTETDHPTVAMPSTPTIAERLPPEASLSTGESLDNGRSSDAATASPTPLTSSSAGVARLAVPDDVLPGARPPPEIPTTDSEPVPPARSTGRRSTQVAPGSGRASDPRTGCEHLFFAFAARCEANHCQLPAYTRHPRCEAVREQRRRDDARRNAMPTS